MLGRHFHDDDEGGEGGLSHPGEEAAHPKDGERNRGGLAQVVGEKLTETRSDG